VGCRVFVAGLRTLAGLFAGLDEVGVCWVGVRCCVCGSCGLRGGELRLGGHGVFVDWCQGWFLVGRMIA
jgi:hypothetical protein